MPPFVANNIRTTGMCYADGDFLSSDHTRVRTTAKRSLNHACANSPCLKHYVTQIMHKCAKLTLPQALLTVINAARVLFMDV